MSHEDKLI